LGEISWERCWLYDCSLKVRNCLDEFDLNIRLNIYFDGFLMKSPFLPEDGLFILTNDMLRFIVMLLRELSRGLDFEQPFFSLLFLLFF
jgi:hypothetical protein